MKHHSPTFWNAITTIATQLTDGDLDPEDRLQQVYLTLEKFEKRLSENDYAELFNETKTQISQLLKHEGRSEENPPTRCRNQTRTFSI